MASKLWQIMTEARMAAAGACLRRHWFAYELGIRPAVEAEPLRFASALRRGRELFRRGMVRGDAIRHALAAYGGERIAAVDREAGQGQLVGREQIARLLGGYFRHWCELDSHTVAVAVGEAFEVAVVNPSSGRASRTFRLAGVFDGVDRLSDGRLAIVQFVTTGCSLAPGSDCWQRREIDAKTSISWLAARAVGQNVDVCLCDAIRRPRIKPKKLTGRQTADFLASGRYCGQRFDVHRRRPRAIRVQGESAEVEEAGGVLMIRETASMYGARLAADIRRRPRFYFARREMPEPATGLEEARRDIWQWTKILRACQRHGRWPRNTSACVGFGRCPYFDLCANGSDPSAGVLPSGFVRVRDLQRERCGEGPGDLGRERGVASGTRAPSDESGD